MFAVGVGRCELGFAQLRDRPTALDALLVETRGSPRLVGESLASRLPVVGVDVVAVRVTDLGDRGPCREFRD
jgi:hypothetical protein